MKKQVKVVAFVSLSLLMCVGLSAQLKVNQYGKVLVGTQSGSGNLNVSNPSGTAFSASTATGTAMYITANGAGAPLCLMEQLNTNYSSFISCQANHAWQFFVRGDGYVTCRGLIVGTETIAPKTMRSLSGSTSVVESPLEKIADLQVIAYPATETPVYTDSSSMRSRSASSSVTRTRLSLVPQQVESILPEVVYDIENGEKGISYTGMMAVVVEALKAQQATIIELRQRLDELTGDTLATNRMLAPSRMTSGNESNSEGLPFLAQNNPNPFNHTTEIAFYLPQSVTTATLLVYNLQGKQLKSLPIQERGQSNVVISGGELEAGMYIYALIADGKEIDNKRMILTK